MKRKCNYVLVVFTKFPKLPFCDVSRENVSTHFYVARLFNKIAIAVITKQNASVLSYDSQTQKSSCNFIQTYISLNCN